MKYNGIDPRTLHPAISINKEYPPGMAARTVTTVRGARAEHYAGIEQERSEYRVKVNIAARTPEEAWHVRALLAGWANSARGRVAALEPGKWPGRAYDAVVQSISAPEFQRGFATVEIIFVLPDGHPYETTTSRATGTGGKMTMQVGGAEMCRPVLKQTMNAASNGLTWSLDGAAFLSLKGSLGAGQVVEVDMGTGGVTIDGVHAEDRVAYTSAQWEPGFWPGRRVVSSTSAGPMEARWHNVWD